tara:strand:+ start:6704 stop:6904 length:201 start_codon:yes stop_codon:yes gene_type:complete
MGRTFQIGASGIEAFMTQDGGIMDTRTEMGANTVIDGNTATTVENPNFTADITPEASNPDFPKMDI